MPPLLHRQAEARRYRRSRGALRAPLRAPDRQEVIDGARLDQLRATKLRALVSDHWDKETGSRLLPYSLPGGAALLSPDAPVRAWVLIDDGVVSRFGAALAWADRSAASSLDVLVDGSPGASGVVARRAAAFGSGVRVWDVKGRLLSPSSASEAPVVTDADVSTAPGWVVSLLSGHGVEVVMEHGVLRGEVLGLEVARMVGDRLEVGVGRHDRSARFDMRPGESLDAALREAVAAVRALRVAGAPRHPANTLARSRWLRSLVCAFPAAFGLDLRGVTPVSPPLPWFDLPEAGAAPCVGWPSFSSPSPVASSSVTPSSSVGSSSLVASSDGSGGGSPVIVVCSVGVDLDLVPTAADCRLLYGTPSSASVLVLPEGDDLPVTRSLAARLDPPAQILTVARGWESIAG